MLMAFRQLSGGLAERPGVYGVAEADAAEAVRLVDVMEAAILAADAPHSRTPVTIAAKRGAVDAARRCCARLVKAVRANAGVGEGDLLMLGIEPAGKPRRGATRGGDGGPAGWPVLDVVAAVPGGHEIAVYDAADGKRRKVPAGLRLELVVAWSPGHTAGDGRGMPGDEILAGGESTVVVTRGRLSIAHPDGRVGSVANYVGRWVNRRGEAGPWSAPVRMMLALPARQQRPAGAAA
jgi:hypothetical protein